MGDRLELTDRLVELPPSACLGDERLQFEHGEPAARGFVRWELCRGNAV